MTTPADTRTIPEPVVARAAGAGPEWYRDLVQGWFRALARRGRSPKTERTYGQGLRDFGRWLDHCRVPGPEHLIPAVLQSWQDDMLERDLAPASRAVWTTAVRGLLRWAARDRLGVAPMLWEHLETPGRQETVPRALAPDHLARIMDHYVRIERGLHPLRDRALFLFLLTTGSRIGAALSLNRDQLGEEQLVVVQKGGSEHVLMPSATSRAWIQTYLRARGRDEQPALWMRVGAMGRHRLTQGKANVIWAELCRELRIPPFTNHALRHTAATELGARGISDTELARHLGWRSNAMAMRYRQLREERRQELVDQLDDLVPAVPTGPVPRRGRPRMKLVKGRGKRG